MCGLLCLAQFSVYMCVFCLFACLFCCLAWSQRIEKQITTKKLKAQLWSAKVPAPGSTGWNEMGGRRVTWAQRSPVQKRRQGRRERQQRARGKGDEGRVCRVTSDFSSLVIVEKRLYCEKRGDVLNTAFCGVIVCSQDFCPCIYQGSGTTRASRSLLQFS